MIGVGLYVIVFRILHVMGGIIWGGMLVMLVLFIQPTAQAVGPAAGPFMRELLAVRRLPDRLLGIAWMTVIAGGFLYWHDWEQSGSLGDFLGSAFGLWLTIGAISALVAVGLGTFATRPTLNRSLSVAAQVAQAGDQAPSGLVQELQALQARGRMLAKWNLAFVAVAAFAMSTARYW